MEKNPTYEELLSLTEEQNKEIMQLKALTAAGLTLGDVSAVIEENEKLKSELEKEKKAKRFYARLLVIAKKRMIAYKQKIATLKRDPLMGIYTRRTLEDFVTLPEDTTYIMCDIDKFTDYNNEYGHEMGDRVLKTIGESLLEAVKRESDFSIRYGGDEILIILTSCGVEDAVRKINEIKELVSAKSQENRIPREVTMSFGMFYNESNPYMKPLEASKLADEALYESKCNGRNQITIHGMNSQVIGGRAYGD